MFEKLYGNLVEYEKLLDRIKDLPTKDQEFFKRLARREIVESPEKMLVNIPNPKIKVPSDIDWEEVKAEIEEAWDKAIKDLEEHENNPSGFTSVQSEAIRKFLKRRLCCE